jgi:hypothetical protein
MRILAIVIALYLVCSTATAKELVGKVADGGSSTILVGTEQHRIRPPSAEVHHLVFIPKVSPILSIVAQGQERPHLGAVHQAAAGSGSSNIVFAPHLSFVHSTKQERRDTGSPSRLNTAIEGCLDGARDLALTPHDQNCFSTSSC